MTRNPTRLQRPHPLPSRQLLVALLASGPLYNLPFRLRQDQSHGPGHLFQDVESPSRLVAILSLAHQDRAHLRISHLSSRLPHPATQHKVAHMQALQHLSFQSQGEIQTQMRTGGDVLGIQELTLATLVLVQRLVDLDITRLRTTPDPSTPRCPPLLRLRDFPVSRVSTMHPLHFRFLDASQVQCK